jgi:hypothetical protein
LRRRWGESRQSLSISDTPRQHLGYHTQRYGQFAIGFYREAAIRHGFNPVLYTLPDTDVLGSLYSGFAELEYVDSDAITDASQAIDGDISDLECEDGHEVEIDLSGPLGELETAASAIEETVSEAYQSFRRHLAFVKTFDHHEFETIYCEREWRAVDPFRFDYGAVAMIVLPRKADGRDFFTDFLVSYVSTAAGSLGIPSRVPVVPWEDLVEH